MKFGLLILLLGSTMSWAASDNGSLASKNAKSTQTGQTQHSFEDLLVQGKYHFSDEAITTVEEDKVLDALIGVRKDFRDRIEESASQR